MRPACPDTPLALAIAALVLATGCYESYTRPFDVLRPDGSVDGARPPIEGGVPIESPGDASTSRPDAGPGRDAGRDAGEDRCLGEEVPDYEGPGCAPETLACLGACAEADCASACLAADPECQRCFDQTLIACGNELGCQELWDAFACCTDWMCTSPAEGADRVTCAAEAGVCEAELAAYGRCLGGEVVRECQARFAACGG